MFIKLQLHHTHTKKTPNKQNKKENKQAKKSPNKLAADTWSTREIDVTVKPSKTELQTKLRQT